jgi:23S rRNA pseudouridine2605 synthase
MHPSFEITRSYAVRLIGALSDEQVAQLKTGIMLDDGPARVDSISLTGGDGLNVWYELTLKEGRNREVRRMFDALGHTVSRLIRVRYGPVALGKLRRGLTRALTKGEVESLYNAVGLERERAE